MDEKDKQSALDKLSGTGIAGGLGGAALLAGLGAAARYSSRPGEEHSILSNPILLGALGAGLGYAGGTALDKIKLDPPVKETWSPGWGTGGLLAGGGLYTIGASAAKKNADEVVASLIRKKKLTTEELNKLIKSLALRGRVSKDIINNKKFHGAAKNLGISSKGVLHDFLKYNAFSPKNALGRGIFYDAPSRLLKGLTSIPGMIVKHPVRSIGKAAPVVAALAGLGILGKKLLSDNED